MLASSANSLWAVTQHGKVYCLPTNFSHWVGIDGALDMKKVCSLSSTCWAVGCNNKVYIYIAKTDLPIRHVEIAYENERWNPIGGFTGNKLLPSDRFPWSNEAGTEERRMGNISLPSNNWDWECDWYIQDSLGGTLTSKQGWHYAVDFPREYTADKKWNSCVRRRKWMRYRRFIALERWAEVEIPPDSSILDITLGEQNVSDNTSDTLSVWAVDSNGKVLFRHGVSAVEPEGTYWELIDTNNIDIKQISVNNEGVFWAVPWYGDILRRVGVTKESPQGHGWEEVSSPTGSSEPLQHVCVGLECVWALNRSGEVWFQRGTDGHGKWIHMVGNMSYLTINHNNLVCGIGTRDHRIYIRTGVTSKALGGKEWKPVTLKYAVFHHTIPPAVSADGIDRNNLNIEESIKEELKSNDDGMSNTTSLVKCVGGSDVENIITSELDDGNYKVDEDEVNHQRTVLRRVSEESEVSSLSRQEILSLIGEDNSLEPIQDVGNSFINEENNDDAESIILSESQVREIRYPQNDDDGRDSDDDDNIEDKVIDFVSAPNLMLKSKKVDVTNKLDDASSYSTKMESDTGSMETGDIVTEGVDVEEDTFGLQYMGDEWVCVSCTSCTLPDNVIPSCWLNTTDGAEAFYQKSVKSLLKPSNQLDRHSQWRQIIVECLKRRNIQASDPQHNYGFAVDVQSWVKTGNMEWLTDHPPQRWKSVAVEIEFGNLFGQLSVRVNKKSLSSKLNLSDITCVVQTTDSSKDIVFCVFTAKRTIKRCPLKFSLTSDADLSDWMTTLSGACNEVREVRNKPSVIASWSTTQRGDIYVSETENTNHIADMYWYKVGGHMKHVETNASGVCWGLGYDCTVWYCTSLDDFHDTSKSYEQTDNRLYHVYENQRWNPLNGFSDRLLPTDRYLWSDKTGKMKREKSKIKLISSHWQWTTDWDVDYTTPGGVDKEGWQYAADFPLSFHGSKTLVDLVRRRRWVRKCRLLTRGPWVKIEDVKLVSISLPIDCTGHVYAVNDRGALLARSDVTRSTPKGSHWCQIDSDEQFISVSCGANFKLWCLATTGAAFYRNGVSDRNIMGTTWFHISSPPGVQLRQISTSDSSVWAVDANDVLWFRENVTDVFPEGTRWTEVATGVKHISSSPGNQLWGIVNFMSNAAMQIHTANGVLAKRTGINATTPKGTGWQLGIGGGWYSICSRAFIYE